MVPQTHNKLVDSSPRLWNDLPPGLWQPGLSFDSFRQSLIYLAIEVLSDC